MDAISVKRTFDHELLTKLCISDDIFEISACDGIEKKTFHVAQFYPYRNICLLVKVNKEIAGNITFEPINNVIYIAHIKLLKKFRGKNTALICKIAIDWLYKSTDAKQVIAYVPAYRKDIEGLLNKCNFRCCGLIKNGFLKDGKLHDFLIFQQEY